MSTNTITEIEQITDVTGKVFAVIARADYHPDNTSFVTPDSFTQELQPPPDDLRRIGTN